MSSKNKTSTSSLRELVNQRIEALRPRLLDTTRRNPLINNELTGRTNSYISIVDELPQNVIDTLAAGVTMHVAPLPPFDEENFPDERTQEFIRAYENAQQLDSEYNDQVEKIDFDEGTSAFETLANLERELKDRIRDQLDLPQRPKSTHQRDLANHAKIHGINPSITLPAANFVAEDDRHNDEKLQSILLPEMLTSRLNKIFNKQRIFEEERGLRVTYLVAGYLSWSMSGSGNKNDTFKSPLILIPIELTRERSSEGERYSITQLNEVHFNPILKHKLESEAQLDISELPLFSEGDFPPVEDIFDSMQILKPKSAKTWEVKREATIGIYPFQGIDLYHDLRTDDIDFSEFEVLNDLFLGRTEGADGEFGISEDEVESENAESIIPHLVLDADSSQFLALLKIACGENLALEGPPGSGKSQTIVNAIANEIARGKRVLFVAQKMTALDVVYARLKSLDLHYFVLPLVGSNSDSESFYNALDERINFQPEYHPTQYEKLRISLQKQRSTLTNYINLLTSVVPSTDIIIHSLMGLTIQNFDSIHSLPLPLKTITMSLDKYSSLFSIEDFENATKDIIHWSKTLLDSEIDDSSPWAKYDVALISHSDIYDAVNKSPIAIQRFDQEISNTSAEIMESLERITIIHDSDDIEKAVKLGKLIFESNENILDFLAENAEQSVKKLNEVLDLYQTKESVSEDFGVDFDNLKNYVNHAADLEILYQLITLGKIKNNSNFSVNDIISHCNKFLSRYNYVGTQIERLHEVGIALPPQKLLNVLEKLANIRSHQWVTALVTRSSVEDAIRELELAQDALTKIYEVLHPNQKASYREIREIKGIIDGAGFFTRLGSTYKSSVNKAKLWLGLSAESKIGKRQLVDDLEHIIQANRELSRISFFEDMGRYNWKTKSKLRLIQTGLAEVIAEAQTAGLDPPQIKYLISTPELENVHKFLTKVENESIDWSFIESSIKGYSNAIKYSAENLDSLLRSESFCKRNKIKSLEDLENAIAIGRDILAINNQVDSILGELNINSNATSKVNIEFYRSIVTQSQDFCADLKNVFLLRQNPGLEELLKRILPITRDIEHFHKTITIGKGLSHAPGPFRQTLSDLSAHVHDKKGFSNLTQIGNTFRSAQEQGFGQLIEAFLANDCLQNADIFAPACLTHYLKTLAESEYGAELSSYTGKSLETARKKLQEVDRELIRISPQFISGEIVRMKEPPEGVGYGRKSEYTDLALIRHELGKKRRIPPRKLLSRATDALLELFPCWMMVPNAVAQHLPRFSVFDIVIIDEASQMTPENSISALMRADRAVISGDTNQLPPSNFFKGLSTDSDEDEDIGTEEESILELANAQFHPKHKLRWHYRSKHEELISFSNHYIYDDSLVIFPSPSTNRALMGVSLIEVNGTYQKGINPAEAQVIVEHAVRLMKQRPDRSIGIVVMNQSQMELIDSDILREAERDPDVANYIDHWACLNSGLERFFVKNLENVQGDERDVILIGTVYGCDNIGKFYQRFGPINGPSGKKRLNVLFTRAKEQIITFTSIPLDKFQPNEQNSGAKLLKFWLQFSATKKLGEKIQQSDSGGVPDSPFEEHVISAVESLGYTAVPQVGVSNYYIDIGVRHPDYPFGYICGIECDGATYHSSKSARDRDRLRQDVLERLGWSLYRIWSTDWFQDPYSQTQRLKTHLTELLSLKVGELKSSIDPDTDTSSTTDSPTDNQTKKNAVKESGVNMPRDIFEQNENQVGRLQDEVKTTLLKSIDVGSLFKIRYLDGPRAGMTAQFWMSGTTDHQSFSVPGFSTLREESPLGQALMDAVQGQIVTYELKGTFIRVELLEDLTPSD